MRNKTLGIVLASGLGIIMAVPAFAAPLPNISFVTHDSSVFLNGGSVTSCNISGTNNFKAEFAVQNSKVVFDITNGKGTVVVSGEKSYTGTVTEVNVSSKASSFSVFGKNDVGVQFISNGECA